MRTSDAVVPGVRERAAGTLGQRGDPLDRDDLGRQLGEHRGGVPGAGTDIEHALVTGETQQLARRRDDQGLGDRLAETDRQRPVDVRLPLQLRRDEQLARNATHRSQHPLVADPAAAQLTLDHPRALARDLVVHFASVRNPA